MIVAVEKGLEDLISQLEQRNYHVVVLGEYNYPIDAAIYAGNKIDMAYITPNNIPNITSGSSIANGNNRGYGVIVINATDKAVDEIDEILKTGVYTPLF